MNIVKGVAELIRRTHSSQAGESSPAERLSPPSPRICFSDGGDEAVLSILWSRYENAGEKAEKKRLFHVFLKQFLTVFRNWEPAYGGQLLDGGSTTCQSSDYISFTGDMVIGCLAGHPAEVIFALTEEITQLTRLIAEFDGSTGRSTKDMSAGSIILIITSEGLPVLDALTIVTRSMHNCRVFGYYSGVQKITALMKGAVVQLKTLASTLFNDGAFSNLAPEKTQLLHQVLSYVISIVCSFMDLNLDVYEKAQLYNNSKEFSLAGTVHLNQFSKSTKDPLFEMRLQWHRKAVISVMEAGGLNWLVELLRVIRRLSLKEKWMDMSIQYLTLGSLLLALCDNPRGQNHFKSIGGLEVLLDGLGLPSSNLLLSENAAHIVAGRDDYPLEKYFVLHLLSLEVLREAVFGNLINMQFLCENGRVDKFANSFCSPAFLLQEYKNNLGVSSSPSDSQMSSSSLKDDKNVGICKAEDSTLSSQDSSAYFWSNYVTELSRVLCSFLPGPEDIVSHRSEVAVARISMPAYVELSIRWVMRVLLTVFPCIKACSGELELPSNLRMFAGVLQHSALDVWSKLLISSPVLIEVLRKEGIWDLIFSENFFYFGPSVELSQDTQIWASNSFEGSDICSLGRNELSSTGVDTLQMEVISFAELAAVSSGSNHNLPESSALLDALEQSACSPEIAHALVKSLLRILQLSTEKTVASFKALNAVSRVLKVGCIQAQEAKHSEIADREFVAKYHKSDLPEIVLTRPKCMEACMELFVEFWSLVDGARSLVLHDSTCIDCLFDLFWEESLRNGVLSYILDLMKIVPSSKEDGGAKLLVCSKYLELFTRMKELGQKFEVLSVDLLVSMRDILQSDPVHYQALFREGECFLHILSLLNCNLDETKGEKLALNVLKTLTYLLSGNNASKAAFRGLVGKGYQTLQSLLLSFCQSHPSEALLNALLDMLVDGHFEINKSPLIKNEDVIILYLCVLQKSSESLRHHGLNVFQQLLRDSLSNRASCVRAGMLDFLLDWFAQEEDSSVVLKIAMLIQVIGGHSISGKDIRKIFAMLRSEIVGAQRQYRSLLLTSVQSMLNEKGPTAFFDLNGNDSGIIISMPLQWPVNKGFSFSCWLRVESFPRNGTVGLFKFLTENGRGCISVLSNDMLIYESINLKRQRVQMHVNLVRKKWHFLCITHSIGRAFSGGSLLRYYVDGDIVSSERCRYPRVSESMTSCSIATKIVFPQNDEDDASNSAPDSFPFHGQIGPVYLFSDAISSEQIQAVHSLGPSYMYSFLEKEAASLYDNPLSGEVLDAKDGLASKIIFGLNAQASDGRKLFNVSPNNDYTSEKSSFEATIIGGSELCSRRLLQQIIYCVGGVSVFFPLITQSDRFEDDENGDLGSTQLMPILKERLTAEVIELIASVLDDNLANQQQMHLLSGFLILGFLLQSVPPKQLNLETLSALKHLFNVVANCGLAELLVKDAISGIFLNPLIWLYSEYEVQRELYMFLIQQFDSDPRLLKNLCRLPRVIDMIWQFYWDIVKSPFAIGGKPLLHPVTGEVIGERPNREEVHKIRLLLLSLGEMSLRQDITAQDIKALVTFFETNQDMTCIEDLLHMVIRAISQKSVLASFLEQVNGIGGCHIFVNLLKREYEPIRLLGLQFLGRLVIGFPAEKKGPKFFNIAVGRSKLQPENTKKNCSRMQPIFAAISDRLFNFQLTDNLCATLFDVLLGGASPKQVLQRQMQIEKQKNKGINSHFVVPQILVLIFRYLYSINNSAARIKIMSDLHELLDSNPLNIEALMEYGWNAWLSASLKLDVVKNYMPESIIHDDDEANEQRFVRCIFCVVLSHYVLSVKGGWQYLEETSNFLLLHSQKGSIACWHLLRDIYDDLIQRLVDFSSEENIFVSQPCRDNTLYFLRLVDEMLISEIDSKLLFPVNSSECPSEILELDSLKDYASAVTEIIEREFGDKVSRNPWAPMQPVTEVDVIDDKWWNLFDNVWMIISEMNGKDLSKMLRKSSSSVGPSIGQRARGLVESLNIPAAEMAAVVVSGGIGNALGGKSNKNIDRAMVLRGDRCPRIVFRLVVLYLCRSSLERASRCVQQVISVLPSLLTSDDEQSKSRLQLFIWFLLTIRSTYGGLDDGARIHVIAHLIRETVNCGKSVLAASMVGRDESDTASNSKDTGSMYNLIQKDRVLTAVSEEAKYLNSLKSDRERQLQDFSDRMDEKFSLEFNNKKAFEEAQSLLHAIHASDESRRTSFLLIQEEEHQNVTEKWMHVFRALIDERGPWSANPFPSRLSIHWKLDKTEDTWRRRPKLRRNYHFDKKLCLPPSSTPSDEAAQHESAASLVGQIPEQMKRFLLKGVRRITDEGSSDPPDTDAEQSGQKIASDEPSESSCIPAVKNSNDLKDLRHDKKEFSPSSQEAETSEVLISVPCVLVSSKRKLAGRLAVMKDVLHFFGQFLVEGTGGSSVFKDLSVSSNFESAKADQKQKFLKWPFNLDMSNEKGISQDDIDAESLGKSQLRNFKRYRRWHMAKVKAVHWTRYLLRYTSIEVFFCDSVTPIFLNFPTQKDAKEVGKLIVATRNELLYPKGSSRDKNGVIQFVDRYIALEMAETARERWRRREITNFEYLMILNTLAGRSYNDLTQYPVFPWVLADYSSEALDFNKSSTFRDLSKPVGALDSKRFEVFEERYCNFCDPDIPSFYYGSHYSSMGIVLYYLLRLEPFTSLHRNLQGGKFDHADRLFQSIEATYRNCLSNTSDVKELIPEFFYMPEFLVNSNSYYFGVKQDGEPIADVSLPAWAKGSPELFVTINREALESEYVSSNLHQWIDLVFGYKQRGKPAVEAANIFYYLTYEGAVDLDTMDDELQRSAIEDQIANFGQTPIQIFRKKHPRRGPPIPIAHPLYFAPDSINLTSIVPCASHTPSPVLYIRVLDSSIALVNEGLTLSVKLWVTTQLQSGGNFTFSGSQDPFFGVGSDILSPRKIGSALVGNVVLGSQCFATLHTPSENFLISCGNWENSFQVISLNDGRMVQSIRQHKDVVSCVAVTADGSFLATGSYDTTVMVWEGIRVKPFDRRVRNAQSEAPRKDYVIVETPFHILCGHDDIVTCLYISVELDIVISGSKDGTCIFHSLRDGRYVRSLRHPSGYALSKLIASHHGRIVLYADDDLSLHLYSINGKHLASSESNGRLHCVELSKCGEFLVSAGDQGQIVVRSMNTLEVVKKYNGVGKIITSLTVTLEECFIVGTKDGVLLVYSIENPQSRRNIPRNAKYKASVAG